MEIKHDTKLAEQVWKMVDKQEKKVESVRNEFYPNGILAECSFSSEANPLALLLAQAMTPPNNPQASKQEQLAEQCFQIKDYVKQGMSGNMVIHFDKGTHMSKGDNSPLGNTIIKVVPMEFDEATYLYIKDGSTVPAKVFIGGDNTWAILALKDDKNTPLFLRLNEFHLLSVQEKTDPHKEVGLMTSYSWLTGKVFSSYISALSLDPIRSLLVSGWLEEEWQRAKDAQEQSLSEVNGGGENGQGE